MKDIFFSHFSYDDNRRENLWRDCIFIFDTNVLTSVYKRSDDARDALYKIIQELGERLWIPFQVVHELLDNRASIAHTQAGLYSAAIESLQSVLEGFDSAIRHPFLPKDLHDEFVLVSSKVIAELESKRDFHDGRITNDDVKSSLAEMLVGKVGSPYTDEQLRNIIKEGEARYANKIPPGFEDINKHKGSSIFSDVCKRYGDLIIWKQVIEHAKALSKPVIFVTGEQKDDWWNRHGGKTIGPLPALINEFYSEVGQDFYLYSHHQFLDLANKYLKQTTSPEVIDEVRDAAIDELKEFKLYNLDHLYPNLKHSHFTDHGQRLMALTKIDNASFESVGMARSSLIESISNLEMDRRLCLENLSQPETSSDPRQVRRRKRVKEALNQLEEQLLEKRELLQLLNWGVGDGSSQS